MEKDLLKTYVSEMRENLHKFFNVVTYPNTLTKWQEDLMMELETRKVNSILMCPRQGKFLDKKIMEQFYNLKGEPMIQTQPVKAVERVYNKPIDKFFYELLLARGINHEDETKSEEIKFMYSFFLAGSIAQYEMTAPVIFKFFKPKFTSDYLKYVLKQISQGITS